MQKQKKIPMRMCVGCKNMFPKRELLRVVKSDDNTLQLDTTGKKNGRGAYICAKQECFQKAVKQKQLQRALEQELSEGTIKALELQIMRREAGIG